MEVLSAHPFFFCHGAIVTAEEMMIYERSFGMINFPPAIILGCEQPGEFHLEIS
jgi:hypothetical protein